MTNISRLELAGSDPRWYALQVKPRHEKKVAHLLSQYGWEPFVPLYTSKRRWSDRTQQIDLPLFPMYAFCRFAATERAGVMRVPGVREVLGVAGTPLPVDDAEIAALREIVRSGLPASPWPYLKRGQRVRIENGPLAGVDGVVMNEGGSSRLVVSVTLLRRSVAVEMEGHWVIPVAG